ncbi:BLUF domain-containing protein [Muricoccus nepalensis]|uniref:BLUF domain-containing protein n=1 Tax=Muricoccus nepalensis TaxID=1854500 RepID=UPI0013871DE3|nr:BLUF domain-containing protein [Roseomonas nepalensis]
MSDSPAGPLHRLVYVSRNLLAGSPGETEAEVLGILAVSRRNNARVGITGALLFSTDCFAQVLEGPLAAVQATFERIQCDQRHTDTVVLSCEAVAGREFAGWSMAYAGPAAQGTERYATLTVPSPTGTGSQRVLDLLQRVVRPARAA